MRTRLARISRGSADVTVAGVKVGEVHLWPDGAWIGYAARADGWIFDERASEGRTRAEAVADLLDTANWRPVDGRGPGPNRVRDAEAESRVAFPAAWEWYDRICGLLARRLGPELPDLVLYLCDQCGFDADDHDFGDEDCDGPIDYARMLADQGGCCCDDDPDVHEYEATGLQCDDPQTWCLACLASAAVDEINGCEPGSTVIAGRAKPDDCDDETTTANGGG